MMVFILAGGESTRAFPYNQLTDKSLLRLGGKPIVRIIVDRLLSMGIPQDVIHMCVLGRHLADFKWEFRDIPFIKYSPKLEAVGTCTHYYYAAEQEFVVQPNDTVLIHYADCVTEIDYKELVEFHHKSGRDCTIAVTKNATHDYSEVRKLDTGMVTAFYEKPSMAYPTWTGIAVFRHGAIKEIMGDLIFGRKVDFGKDIIPKLVEKGKVSAYEYNGLWYDTGNAHSYNKLKTSFESGDLFI